jgi:putative phage-type endonuclease
MKLDIKPNTNEWLALRKSKVGSSDASAIMGCGFLTPYQLWEQKIGLTETESNFAMQEGVRLEPIARERLQQHFGIDFDTPVYQHDDYDFMIASLDAYNEQKRCLVEIKCGSSSFAKADVGVIPDYYYAQMQHQMEVVGLDKMHYYCFNGEKGILLEVYRDTPYIKSLLEAEKKFWDCLQNFLPPALTDKDYLKILTDEAYEASRKLESVKEQIETLTQQEKALRDQILRMADGRNSIVGVQKVTKVISQGHVNYKEIPELKNVDLNKYRKAPTTSYRITKVK